MPRILDIVLAALLLVLTSPVMAVVALANRFLTGQAFFRQVRIGRRLAPFTILKFQTMAPPPPGATTVAGADRSRVTPLGRFLRASKIDEIPQLLNVLRGDMGLVGPRALTPNEVARIPQEVAAAVYALRPGMTGLGSLVYSDEERHVQTAADPEGHYFGVILPQKVALELAYARRKKLSFDLALLVLTPLALFHPGAARRLALRLIDVRPAPAVDDGGARVPAGDVSDV